MDEPSYMNIGSFDPRYREFLETVSSLRPALHRYCARMTGSVMDGEDVVQEALFEAYRKLDKYDGSRPLKPWLFRISHNRCIDFLRRKRVWEEAEAAAVPEETSPDQPNTIGIDKAFEHLVVSLPPKERACILLKDVFDYSLEEIAELVDSTVGGVKAALNRGRTKLAASAPPANLAPGANPELVQVLRLYVDRFNRRDWDGVRELISADARLLIADRFAGKVAGAPYFPTYERWPMPWKLAVGKVDGEPVVIVLKQDADKLTPYAMVRLQVANQRIEGIVDYLLCHWMIQAAASISLAGLDD